MFKSTSASAPASLALTDTRRKVAVLELISLPRLLWLLALSVEGLIRVDPPKTRNMCWRLRRVFLSHHDGALKAILARGRLELRPFRFAANQPVSAPVRFAYIG
jgi:hypothetical protein